MERVDGTLPASRVRGERAAISAPAGPDRFVVITLFSCFFLQRFALPLAKIPIATLLVLGAAVVDLMAQRLVFSGRRALIFCALATASLISTAFSAAFDLAPREGSVPSLAQNLLVTSFAALSFRTPMQEDRFYAFFTNFLVIVAAAGILQFAAQFFGVLIFQFSGIVPNAWLTESYFSTSSNTLYYGSDIYRSNGFFLLEPSILGQFMAVAIMMEMLCRRRPLWLFLFGTALLLAASGTGVMVLAAFALTMAFGLGPRRAVALLVVWGGAMAVALLAVNLLLPQITATLLGRVGEFSNQDTSGYGRFVAAFAILADAFRPHPWAVLTGIGPGTAQHLVVPYEYLANTITKYIIEYGIFGFVLYLALILSSERTYRQRLLLLPLMVLFLFGGQSQQLFMVALPVFLATTVSRLEPGQRTRANQPPAYPYDSATARW
jgi:hypothetical protein